jgi:tight adherence protein B
VIGRVAGASVGVLLFLVLTRTARRADARVRARRLRPVERTLPTWCRDRVADRIARADLDISPEAALGWWGLGILAAGWFALLLAAPLIVPMTCAGIAAGPVLLATRARQADRRARVALPDLLDRVVAHVRAGDAVAESLHAVATRQGPLASDLRRLSARLRLGAPLEDALHSWAEERPVAGVRSAAGAMTMATSIGGSAAGPLEGLAASLRTDESAAGEARALSAQARVSATVVGLAPLAYLAFSAMADPASAQVLVTTTAGRICLGVGLVLEGLAALWMRALVRTP